MCLSHLKNRDPKMCRVALGMIKASIIYIYIMFLKRKVKASIYLLHLLYYRGFIPFTLGLHDTNQMREQFGHTKQTAKYSEFFVS